MIFFFAFAIASKLHYSHDFGLAYFVEDQLFIGIPFSRQTVSFLHANELWKYKGVHESQVRESFVVHGLISLG